MIEILEPVEDFAKRYKIKSDPIACGKCDKMVTLTKCLSIKDYRALAGYCECGNQVSTFVPMGEKIKFWKRIFP